MGKMTLTKEGKEKKKAGKGSFTLSTESTQELTTITSKNKERKRSPRLIKREESGTSRTGALFESRQGIYHGGSWQKNEVYWSKGGPTVSGGGLGIELTAMGSPLTPLGQARG